MMGEWRVVATVAPSRHRYLEVLLPYLEAETTIIDRCELWCNTDEAEDVTYIRQKAFSNAFFRVIEARSPIYETASVNQFFRYCTEPDTIYIRFDDDICWVAPDAVKELIRFRLENREFPLIFANTVNNSVCSYIHQRMGCTPMDEVRHTFEGMEQAASFAELIHETFLQSLQAGHIQDYMFSRWILLNYERMSTNCICWFGRDFGCFGGEINTADESWLTTKYPAQLQQPNAICGTALVSQFAQPNQRLWLEKNTSLLRRYQLLTDQLLINR